MTEKLGGKWRNIITVVTLLALALLIFLIWDQIKETFANLKEVNLLWILLIILLQFVNHHSYARIYKDCFAVLGSKLKYWSMYRISLEINFVNNVFPTGGVSGFSYFGLRMSTFKVPPGKSALVQMLRMILVFVSFQVLLVFGLLSLAAVGQASNFTILVSSSLATLIFVGTLFAAYIVGSRTRIDNFFTGITKFLNRLIQFVRPKHPETINIKGARKIFIDLHKNYLLFSKNLGSLWKPLFFALLANTVEIASIYVVYLAFGEVVNPGALIIAYVIANFAGLISVLPGGVGIYEGLMTAVLVTAGVPAAVSIPATITYRVLTSAIQLPPGYYFYHKAVNFVPKKA